MPKLQEIRKKRTITYTLTIPKAVVELMGWKKGTNLELQLNKETGRIELIEMKPSRIGKS